MVPFLSLSPTYGGEASRRLGHGVKNIRRDRDRRRRDPLRLLYSAEARPPGRRAPDAHYSPTGSGHFVLMGGDFETCRRYAVFAFASRRNARPWPPNLRLQRPAAVCSAYSGARVVLVSCAAAAEPPGR
jgi:hypothetical protein